MTTRRTEVTSERRKFDEFATRGGTSAPRLAFGPFVLDPESGRLFEGGRPLPLAPKPFETLYYLASRRGHVVTKAELMERLWPGTFVTDDVLVQCVMEIRRTLGDHAKTPRYVRTIPRKGYEFLVPVRALDEERRAAEAGEPSANVVAFPSAERPAPPTGDGVRRSARLSRKGYLAGAGTALAALALAGYLARGLPREPPAPRALPGSLVVMPVHLDGPEEQSGWLRHGLPEMMQSQLGQAAGLQIVARHRLAAALASEGYDEERAPSAQAAEAIARKLQAEKMVTGSYVRVGDRFVLTAQITDVATGRGEGAASVQGVHPAGVLDAASELSLELLRRLRPGGGEWRPTRMPTASIEAYRHYAEAVRDFARGGRAGAEQAEAGLDKALALDPRFALAYLKKAEILQWRREWAYGEPDPAPAVLAAARLVANLPERERRLVESFAALILRNDPQAALKEWNALLQFHPTYSQEVGIPGLVTGALLRLGRWDDLILVGEAYVDSPSLARAERARLCTRLAQAFRRKGEFEQGRDYARRAVDEWPTREGPEFLSRRLTLGRTALEVGRLEEALVEFRAVAAAPEADALNLTDAAWGFYMAGHAGDAEAILRRALRLDRGYGNAYHLQGWLLMLHGRHVEAARSFSTAFERTPRAFGSPHQGLVEGDLAAAYYAGVAYEAAGSRSRAKQAFEELIAHCERLLGHPSADPGGSPRWQAESFRARAAARLGRSVPEPTRLLGDDATYYVQSARLHAVLGDHVQALRELAQGLAAGFGEYQHIQDDPDFASLRSRPEFRRLVTERLPQPR